MSENGLTPPDNSNIFFLPFPFFPFKYELLQRKKKEEEKTYLWVIKLGEVFAQYRQITRISLIKNINFKKCC